MAGFTKLKNAIPGVLKATGSDITLRFVTIGNYNETNGTVSESNTDVNIKALVEGVTKSEVNDLINQEDKRVLIAAKDVNTTPTTKDKVLINNIIHQIITVDTTEAAGVAITFTLIVRS
jgi:hypothetical protein|tara:strand:- start:18 stop:374 length:357 start_codon:yes stop_codon:yes gene_type:complete